MDRQEWLAQVSEDILEPDRIICDPHHHLWDHPNSRYLLDEILDDTSPGHNVVSTVFVECGSMYRERGPEHYRVVGETEFVQGIAAMAESGQYGPTRVADGIVSFADLTQGTAVKQILEAHMAASPNRFKGIRHAAGWHESSSIRNSHTNPPESLMRDEQFLLGFEQLGKLGLSFDAWFYHYQLPEFVDLANSFPDVTIILDHFGGPLGIGPFENKQDEVFSRWQELIEPLRSAENVFFKLGGINMKINGYDWHRRDLPPGSDELVDKTARYYEFCINTFGASRCMFESNFPVDKESCSYHVLWNAFKKISRSYSETEKSDLFHDSATRAYRLNET